MNKKIEPQEIDNISAAFPTATEGLLPEWEEIPNEFKENYDNKWITLFNQMFYCGGKLGEMKAKPGIDAQKAWRHIRYCMGSFEPKHEHKTTGCAYLMSLWFDEIEFTPKPLKL